MSRETPFAEFAAGTVVLDEGEAARAMYIIETGRVEIQRGGRTVAELGPGEVFGEMALLQEEPHCARAVARTAVRALVIDQAAFHAVLRANPEVAVQLMRQLVLRLRSGEQRRQELEDRLAATAGAVAVAPAPVASPPARPVVAPAQVPAQRPAVPTAANPADAPPSAPAAPAAAAASSAAARPAAADAAVAPVAPGTGPAAPVPAAAARPPQQPPRAEPARAPAAAAEAPAPAKPTPPPAGADFVIRHAQGEIQVPPGSEYLIGRPDPATGQVPEINLGPLDVARSLSRRHARLHRRQAGWELTEEAGVANGTWVNGERLQAGTSAVLSPGDRLRFGAVEVEFVAR